jgi:ureidoacrylate peracid hydrolase
MTLDPSRCAIVVVDMQNDFCHAEGAAARLGQDVTAAQAIVPEIEALAAAGRRHGVPVIFVRTAHSDWTDTPAWRARGRAGTTLDVERAPIAEVGSWGAELFGVVPQPEDLVLVKHRYSAFAHTELELVLRAKRRDTVLLGGTRTNVCVEYTAADALMHDIHPVLVRECVAADGDERETAALRDFTDHLGAVVSRGEVERAWLDQLQREEAR